MGMMSEFKDFAMKGNLVDMAVGFVMGSAFATVVGSFLKDIFMPAISPVMGGLDLGNMKHVLKPGEAGADGAIIEGSETAIRYGQFINEMIAFIIVALVMFMIIKGMNKAMKAADEEEPGPTPSETLLAEIRDSLKK